MISTGYFIVVNFLLPTACLKANHFLCSRLELDTLPNRLFLMEPLVVEGDRLANTNANHNHTLRIPVKSNTAF